MIAGMIALACVLACVGLYRQLAWWRLAADRQREMAILDDEFLAETLQVRPGSIADHVDPEDATG